MSKARDLADSKPIVEQTTGFTVTAGSTTPQTLTVDAAAQTSKLVTKAKAVAISLYF